MSAASNLRVEWVTGIDRFLALRPDWNSLGASTIETVFLTHDWLANWLAELAPDAELRVLTAWESDRLVAALPLVADAHDSRGRRWTFMGVGTLTPNHLDLIAEPAFADPARTLFAEELLGKAAEWDVLDLDKLPADSGTAAAFDGAFRTAGLATSFSTSAVCLVCDLPPTYEEYLAARSKSTRKQIKATQGWLRKQPPSVRLAQVESEEGALAALEALERFHQARWEAKGYPGAFADDRVRRFHRAQVRAAFSAGTLRMYMLSDADEMVAVSYNFLVGSTAQAYLTSFDPRWSKSSPGVLLRAFVIERLIAEGARQFDWLEGAEEYKRAWCTEEREDVRLSVFGRTLPGRVARVRQASGEAAVRVARRWVSPELREKVVKSLARSKTKRPPADGGS